MTKFLFQDSVRWTRKYIGFNSLTIMWEKLFVWKICYCPIKCLWSSRLLNAILGLNLLVWILHFISSHEKESCVSADNQKISRVNNGAWEIKTKSIASSWQRSFFICLFFYSFRVRIRTFLEMKWVQRLTKISSTKEPLESGELTKNVFNLIRASQEHTYKKV